MYQAMINSPDQDHNKYWSKLGDEVTTHAEACKLIDEYRYKTGHELFTRRMTDEDYKVESIECDHNTLEGYSETGTRGVYSAMRCSRCKTNFNGGWNKK